MATLPGLKNTTIGMKGPPISPNVLISSQDVSAPSRTDYVVELVLTLHCAILKLGACDFLLKSRRINP